MSFFKLHQTSSKPEGFHSTGSDNGVHLEPSPKSPRRPFFATRLCAVVLYYERWRSLSVLASPTSLFRSWAPNYCWHDQEPGYNFHPTRLPQPRKTKQALGPLALWPSAPCVFVRALKPRPWPGLACLLSSWFSYGQGGREGKSRHHRPPVCSSPSATAQGNAPAVGTESGPPAVPRRMVVDALRRGETRRHPQSL